MGNCKEEKTDKIWNLYSHGQNRLEKEFDIVNLTKSIRYLSKLKKDTEDPLGEFKFHMGKPNVINMDKESDSEISQSSDEQVEQKVKKETIVKRRTPSMDMNRH